MTRKPAFNPFRIARWLPLLLLPVACLTPVDIEIERKEFGAYIAISGQISNQEDRSMVQVGTAVENGAEPFPVSQAIVRIIDNDGFFFDLAEDELFPGRYVMEGTGIPGKQYTLEVTLPDGRVFKSQPETLLPPAAADAVTYEFGVTEFVDFEGAIITEPRVNIYTQPDLTGPVRPLIRWYVEETYLIRPTNFPDPFGFQPPDCFVRQAADPQRVMLFDGRVYSGEFPEPVMLASRKIDQSFFYRHYFSVYQASLSPAAFDYWTKVDILTSQAGSIFDTPPARISGNITQEGKPGVKALGYFQAAGENLSRFYIVQSELPDYAYRPAYCDYDPVRYTPYPDECLNCLLVRNSTLRRPWWF